MTTNETPHQSVHLDCRPACAVAPAQRWTAGQIRAIRAAAVAGATAAATAVWAVAVPLAGATLSVRANGAAQHVGPASVASAALLASLAAWLLLAVLEHYAQRPRRTWSVTAGVIMGASLAGPLSSGIGGGAVVALAAMHLAVAAVLISVLPRTARC